MEIHLKLTTHVIHHDQVFLFFLFSYFLIFLFSYFLIFLFSYFLIFLFSYFLIFLFSYFLIFLFSHLFSYFLIFLFSYFLIFSFSHFLIFLFWEKGKIHLDLLHECWEENQDGAAYNPDWNFWQPQTNFPLPSTARITFKAASSERGIVGANEIITFKGVEGNNCIDCW